MGNFSRLIPLLLFSTYILGEGKHKFCRFLEYEFDRPYS